MEFKAQGRKIRELRLRSGLSQDDLAEASGLSLRSIQRIENDQTIARGDSLKRISKALQVDISELGENTDTAITASSTSLKQNPAVPLLLMLSAFAYLWNPIAGVLFPTVIWFGWKKTIEGVEQAGIRTIIVQLVWCGILALGYLYIFSIKYFGINLPVPDNPKGPVLFFFILYLINACAIVVIVITWISKGSFRAQDAVGTK